jgi:cytochrome c peroxidase
MRRPAHALVLVAALAACGGAPADEKGPPLPWARRAFPAMIAHEPADAAQIALGRSLFYDPLLSADRAVACATCHSELWGMSDGLPRSVGLDGEGAVGPGRHGPNTTARNAPTLWNAAYRRGLFWDGRAASLEEQALMPIENDIEMGRELPALLADLQDNDEYRALFMDAFGEVSAGAVARALAAFERTFVSDLAPYDRYAAGDEGALSEQAIAGMFLFADAGCADCHAPPLFESERYVDRSIAGDDEGRAAVTGDVADHGAFRVPTLRNLRETGPYFHDGSVVDLEDAVAHEAGALSEDEVAAIAEFIRKGLMDRSREPDRPDSVPSGLPVPLDNLRIPR